MKMNAVAVVSICLFCRALALPRPIDVQDGSFAKDNQVAAGRKWGQEMTDGTQIGEGWKRDEVEVDGTQIGEGWKRSEFGVDGTQIGEGW